jgi:hypothetical protein
VTDLTDGETGRVCTQATNGDHGESTGAAENDVYARQHVCPTGPIEQPRILGWWDTVARRTVEAMNETITATAETSFAAARPAQRRLPLNARHALLTAHIVLAVAFAGRCC